LKRPVKLVKCRHCPRAAGTTTEAANFISLQPFKSSFLIRFRIFLGGHHSCA